MSYGLGDELRSAQTEVEVLRSTHAERHLMLLEADSLLKRCAFEVEELRAMCEALAMCLSMLKDNPETYEPLAHAVLEKYNETATRMGLKKDKPEVP